MPMEDRLTPEEFDIAEGGQPVAFTVRTKFAGRAVEILRAVPDEALSGFLLVPAGDYPVTLLPGTEAELTFKVRTVPRGGVNGQLELHVAEGPLTAIRAVRVSLWPKRAFDGVFAVDFGASRLAAAYIDPASGNDRPVPVVFANGEPALSSTFAAHFSHDPPVGVAVEELGPALPGNLFFRPRQFLAHGGRRTVFLPGGSSKQVDEAESAAWALADFVRRAGRLDRPGWPHRLTVPLPASLTPAQAERFQDLVDRVEDMPGRINTDRATGLVLDEASAAAFTWVRESERELADRCRSGAGRLMVLVLDAGAGSTDLSLLELNVAAFPNGRLKVTPRQVAKDGFHWLCGDRATAFVFRLIKQQAAEQLRPGSVSGAPEARREAAAEAVLSTRFVDTVGPEYTRANRNFQALWQVAEKLKLANSPPSRESVAGLVLKEGPADPVMVQLPSDYLPAALSGDVERCRRRLDALLLVDEAGSRHCVDRLLITGAAAKLALFMPKLLEPFVRSHDTAHHLGVNERLQLIDWTDYGKKAVAFGAALATYYRNYTTAEARNDGTSRLLFLMEEFRRRLPFSLLAGGGGYLNRLLPLGQSFEEHDGQLLPQLVPLAWQPKIPFFRCAGGGPLPRDEEHAEDLAQYLGQASPPKGQVLQVALLPNHQLQLIVDGQTVPITPDPQPPDPLNDPFGGYL
jgi:hypothetical protein